MDQPHQNHPRLRLGTPLTPTHLPYHDRESKDACEVVQQLENDLKERLGVRQAPDGDEGFDCPVVAADVAGGRRGEEEAALKAFLFHFLAPSSQPLAMASQSLLRVIMDDKGKN